LGSLALPHAAKRRGLWIESPNRPCGDSSASCWLLAVDSDCESFRLVDGFRFSTEVSVRFSETDAQGIANNAVYLNWFEVARVAYLGRFPGGYRGLIESGVEATTIETYVRHRAPCRFDDRLRVHARARDLRGARFRFEYVVERISEPAATVADGWTTHASVDAGTLRPTRTPGWLEEAIHAAEE
jgi:acyl-CoA thioester hydrolase